MATQLVNGGRILSDGSFETYDKDSGEYVPSGETVSGDDFGEQTVGGGANYTGDNQVVSGLVTSDSASNAVTGAQDDLNNIGSSTGATSTGGGGSTDQLSALFAQISNLRGQLTSAKEAERLQKERATDIELDTKLAATGSSEEGGDTKETDLSRSINAINQGSNGDTSGIEDSVVAAMTQTTLNNLALIEQSSVRLNDFAKTMSQFSQAEVDDINATAMRAVERQIAENARVQRAMEFAGVRSGRAQMAPRVEGTLIHEIIEQGLDRINVIEEKKTSAIRVARKAEAEFNYQLFTDSVQLAKDYNQEIEDSVSALKAEVRQAEKDEKEELLFNQGQEERSALILAGELTDATPEQIADAAAANGIDIGLLTKAVNDAKFEQEDRDFETANNALTLRKGEASIKQSEASLRKTNNDIRLDNADAAKEEKSTIPKDVEQGFRSDARLSESEIETVWSDIQKYGLDQDTVEMWIDEKNYDAEQIKHIISGHEKSQRSKGKDDGGNDVLLPSETEKALHLVIDKIVSDKETAESRRKFNEATLKNRSRLMSSPESFFKN